MRSAYRRYDPRLRNLVATSGDIAYFVARGVRKSTARQWVKDGPKDFFTLPELEFGAEALVQENIVLKASLAAAEAKIELVLQTIRIFGFQVQYQRLPRAAAKAEIIDVIKKAAKILPVSACLAAIGLSSARFHHWLKRLVKCQLDDQPSCPRVSPTQLTGSEVGTIRELYTSKEFAHYSMLSLSWLARKTGAVIASASTWSRVVRQLGLNRNRVRIYPPKPKTGIRASAPGQIWHIDITILRLQDGSRAFVQAVIDNFSRYVLAWQVSKDYGGLRTKDLLLTALAKAHELGLRLIPNVFVDSGVENLNEFVNSLISSNLIIRTIAQIDIEFSNSMIEMLFHRLKHRYLFSIPLTNFDALVKGANFFFTETNVNIPHSALRGATPEEAITGQWTDAKIAELKARVLTARQERVATNRSRRCGPCLARTT